jgi:MtN3 and saliva related transmembrane protein
MEASFYIGMIAAVFTTTAFLPQVIKSIKSKHTKDISLLMYSVFALGVFLWIVYGIMLGRAPIIIANVVTFLLAVVILYLKIKFG